MTKITLILMLGFNILLAQAFNFTESRYSDATGNSTIFKGEIGFLGDGVKIYYPKTDRFIEYENDTLRYTQDGEEVELSSMRASYIMKYFDILILVHNGDEDTFKKMFSITKKAGLSILTPTGDMKKYISHLELSKEDKELKFIKLYLKNDDHILITIDDKIQ